MAARMPLVSRQGKDLSYNIHYMAWATPRAFPQHTNSDYCDVTYVTEGALEEEVNNREYVLNAGDLVLVREGDTHDLRSESFACYNVRVRHAQLELAAALMGAGREFGRLLGLSTPPRFSVPQAMRCSLRTQLAQLLAALGTVRGNRLCCKVLVDVVGFLIDGRAQDDQAEDTPYWLAVALEEADRRLEDGFSVSDLVRACERTHPYVTTTFTRFLGMPPRAYLLERKLERAAVLLSNSTRPILQISVALGFGSLSYFYKRFKEKYGLSPAKYRAKSGMRP